MSVEGEVGRNKSLEGDRPLQRKTWGRELGRGCPHLPLLALSSRRGFRS